MAKGNMLLGYSRGSVGDVTFAKIKGQQIARARNRNPNNPRTSKQSYQRGRFAAAVKFYTRGNQAFYKFAFENKKQYESDYNAFMRENVRRAPAISREAFNYHDYPVFAPFLMAKGTLLPLNCYMDTFKPVVEFNIAAPETLPTTIGALSEILLSDENFKDGDILTMVGVNSDFGGEYPSAEVTESSGGSKWVIKQFIIDATSNATIEETIGMTAVSTNDNLALTDATGQKIVFATYTGFTCVHSRNTNEGLKSSTQELILNNAAKEAYDNAFAEAYKQAVIASWQAEGSVDAQPEAILQGSIAYGNQ